MLFRSKEAYRLGTVVVHKNSKNNTLDIVDGQQRITTIVLLIKAIMQDDNLNKKFHTEYNEKSENEIKLPTLKFKNPISITNIKQNFQELHKRIKEIEFDENVVYFILQKCEVVYVELDDISEAFQFFDSQNARGKDLAPHDLLKSYHLREMNSEVENLKVKILLLLLMMFLSKNRCPFLLLRLFGSFYLRINSSIYINNFSCDITRFFRNQKAYQIGNFFGFSKTICWN